MSGKWAELDWYLKHRGEECWVVCRNGHLWSAVVPWPWELTYTSDYYEGKRHRAVVARVTRCSMCKLLKEAGKPGLRGITAVHPDMFGEIKARKLLDGTIEHHHPEQVDRCFKPKRVKDWGAVLAWVGLSYGRKQI